MVNLSFLIIGIGCVFAKLIWLELDHSITQSQHVLSTLQLLLLSPSQPAQLRIHSPDMASTASSVILNILQCSVVLLLRVSCPVISVLLCLL